MSLQPLTDRLHLLEEEQRLRDSALAEAQHLRREAIDDFWRGANAFLGQLGMSAHRSGARLAQRLRRRWPQSSTLPKGFVC